MSLQQFGEVVEADRDVGMVRAEAFFVDGERAAHQRLGLDEPVGGLQQLGEVVESDRDVGMVRPEALFVDGERAAHQRLGLGVQRLCVEQHAELIHEPCCRLGNAGGVRMRRHGARMRGERVECRPIADIVRAPCERRVDPTQRLDQTALPRLARKAAPRHVLHQAVDEEERPFGVARHQRIGGEIVIGVAQVLGFGAGDRHIEERFRHFFGREPGEPLEQPPAALAQLRNRRLPGDGDGTGIAGHRLIEPRQHFVALRAPLLQILPKSQPALSDEGRRLFQRECEPAEFFRHLACLGLVVGRCAPAVLGARQQERRGIIDREHVEFERLEIARKIREPAGDDHVAAGSPLNRRSTSASASLLSTLSRIRNQPGLALSQSSTAARRTASSVVSSCGSNAPESAARLRRSASGVSATANSKAL